MEPLFDILPWDGTHIGDITNDIGVFNSGLKHGAESSYVISYKNKNVIIFDFENKFPLIIDELKSIFGLTRMFYHQCTIDNKEYTICRQLECDTTLTEYSRHPDHFPDNAFFINEIRRIFVFRSVFFLSFNNDTSVYVTPLGVTLYNKTIKQNTALPISRIETKYNIVKQTTAVCPERPDESHIVLAFKTHGDVPKHIIAKYFNNDYDMFQEEVLKMRAEISAIDLKFKIQQLIQKYEPGNYLDWANAVYLNWEA